MQILTELGVDYEIVDYLNNPPSADELQTLANKLGMNPSEFIRKKETEFKELNLSTKLNDSNALFSAMSQNPKLIERPIVVKGDKAVLGRPPEKVREFLAVY